jgi:hypothetical protein
MHTFNKYKSRIIYINKYKQLLLTLYCRWDPKLIFNIAKKYATISYVFYCIMIFFNRKNKDVVHI